VYFYEQSSAMKWKIRSASKTINHKPFCDIL